MPTTRTIVLDCTDHQWIQEQPTPTKSAGGLVEKLRQFGELSDSLPEMGRHIVVTVELPD